MKITIYGGFYHVLARKSQHFSHMLCTIILSQFPWFSINVLWQNI